MLPEFDEEVDEITMDDFDVGDPEYNTPEEIQEFKHMLYSYKDVFAGKGNALPPPARGVICDIDVGDARPVNLPVRGVKKQYLEKLFALIKALLKAGVIEFSESEWGSPIVIVIKKNGVDIRLCIDYRAVNKLTKLMVYPMPLVNDLLEDLEGLLWFCALDMASGFWVVEMTPRAQKISAFVTPLGHFEWKRMPFGLKNAPQIYQRVMDNKT